MPGARQSERQTSTPEIKKNEFYCYLKDQNFQTDLTKQDKWYDTLNVLPVHSIGQFLPVLPVSLQSTLAFCSPLICSFHHSHSGHTLTHLDLPVQLYFLLEFC